MLKLLYLINKRWKTRRNKVRTHSFSFFSRDDVEAGQRRERGPLQHDVQVAEEVPSHTLHSQNTQRNPFDDVILYFPI